MMDTSEADVTTASTVAVTPPAYLNNLIYVTDGIVTNVLVVAGLLANALTLAVLSRPSMHSSTNSYLSALAVCDSVVLACSALLIGVPALPLNFVRNYVDGGPYAYVLSYVYPLALVAQTATVWLTVSFAVERYIGVQYPLRAASLCTVQRARSANIFVWLFLMTAAVAVPTGSGHFPLDIFSPNIFPRTFPLPNNSLSPFKWCGAFPLTPPPPVNLPIQSDVPLSCTKLIALRVMNMG